MTFVCIGFVSALISQQNLLETRVNLPALHNLKDARSVLEFLSEKYNVTFSYNASILRDNEPVKWDDEERTLEDMLRSIFPEYELNLSLLPPDKIVITGFVKPPVRRILYGQVYDKSTGESIVGAIVRNVTMGKSVLTNDKGYFIMKSSPGKMDIEVNYLAYKTYRTSVDITYKNDVVLNMAMESDSYLDTIVIDNATQSRHLSDGGHIIDIFKNKDYKSVSGENDIIFNARILPGVQSGNEGQSGLFVRGGTPDQNLILLDGMALYETSHVAGISSIFMEESIKEASLMRNGFPARFGGRLSSVLDVKLKEGDKNKHHTHLSAGLAGARVHFNGPLSSEKTTYSVTARTSWVNLYINKLLRRFTRYDNINVSFHDVLAKVTHRFSPTHSLSATVYNGADRLQLVKTSEIETADFNLDVFDRNSLNWGTTLATLNWNFMWNDKINFKIQSGFLDFQSGTRSSYIFNTVFTDSESRQELDLISQSRIADRNLRADMEYYINDRHVVRLGTNALFQQFNPSVRQSTVILDGGREDIIEPDSLIKAQHYQFYIEDNFKINTSLFLYGGLHLGVFNTSGQTYTSLQPRFKALWTPHKKHMFSLAFGRMEQYLHLLTNPGLGMPSDIWVPATSNIRPQSSSQWSGSYTFYPNDRLYFHIGAYSKRMFNVLEFTYPLELFHFLFTEDGVNTHYNTTKDWERNVLTGNSESRGLEFLMHRAYGRLKGWLSLTWSQTLRNFPDLNNGEPFPATHDKTWDVHTGLTYSWSRRFSTGMNFVYNTGNTFTLATEEFLTPFGVTALRADGRNNYRLPPFHQMSINASYTRVSEKMETQFSLNIYNVYNRLNAYFIYIYQNPEPPRNKYLRKVSILPFTPSLSFQVKF
jgi:hypothetical protein